MYTTDSLDSRLIGRKKTSVDITYIKLNSFSIFELNIINCYFAVKKNLLKRMKNAINSIQNSIA